MAARSRSIARVLGSPLRRSVSASISIGSEVRCTVVSWCTVKCALCQHTDWKANLPVVSRIANGVLRDISIQPPFWREGSSTAGSALQAASRLSLLSLRRAAATQLRRWSALQSEPCLSGTGGSCSKSPQKMSWMSSGTLDMYQSRNSASTIEISSMTRHLMRRQNSKLDLLFMLPKASVVPLGTPGPGFEWRVCPSAMSAATPVGAATSTPPEPNFL